MKTKICPFCGKEFTGHGNSRYCPGKNCAYQTKIIRSTNQYAKKNLKLDPLWANEKILRDNYYTDGPQPEIDPNDLEAAGFDFDLNSEEKNIDGIIIFCMRKFGFSFKKNKTIIIWKLK